MLMSRHCHTFAFFDMCVYEKLNVCVKNIVDAIGLLKNYLPTKTLHLLPFGWLNF